MPKKPKKNPTDPIRLAYLVVEAAIGEPLIPPKAKILKTPRKTYRPRSKRNRRNT